MSNKAYSDSDQTTIIYANTLCDNDRATTFYCENDDCKAHVKLVSRNGEYYFQNYDSNHPHIFGCWSYLNGTEKKDYESIKFGTTIDIENFINKISRISSSSKSNKRYISTPSENLASTKLNSLLELYIYYKKSVSKGTCTGELNEFICCKDNQVDHKSITNGNHLIECTFIRPFLEDLTMIFVYPVHSNNSKTIYLKFTNKVDYWKIVTKYQKTSKCTYLLAGTVYENTVTFHSSKQIYRILQKNYL